MAPPDTPGTGRETLSVPSLLLVAPDAAQRFSEAQAEIRRLRDHVDLEKRRADLLAANLENVRTAMRMLTAGPSTPGPEGSDEPPAEVEEEPAEEELAPQPAPVREPWWWRMFGG